MLVSDALTGSHLPRPDAEVLLAKAMEQSRTWLLAHPEAELTHAQWAMYTNWIERRRKYEPIAYILGEQEFYGRPFTVDRRVLIPRPSTEGIVRAALELLRTGHETEEDVDTNIIVRSKKFQEWTVLPSIVDIGTGSGCIGITLALELPDAHLILTDVSADALEVARINAKRHGVADRTEFKEGRGLVPLAGMMEPFLIVTNPPYIPHARVLMRDVVEFEPHVALFGGEKGIDVSREVMEDAKAHPACVGIVMEGETDQFSTL